MKEENKNIDEAASGQKPLPQNPAEVPAKRKKHSWRRRAFETLACMLVLLLLIPVLIYIPPVQNFLVRVATGIVADKTGMKISVDKFRLKFPLDVALQGVTVMEASGDTMVAAKELIADVKLLPLIHLDAQVNRLVLVDGYYRMLSSDSSMLMTIKAGLLRVDDKSSMNLAESKIDLNDAYLRDGDVSLSMDVWKQKTTPQDSSSTPFYIKANKLKLDNMRFQMSMLPTIDTLRFSAANLVLENGVIDLRDNKMNIGKVAASKGYAEMLTPSPEYVKAHPAPASDTTSSSAPFVIAIDSISLAAYDARYAVEGVPAVAGFDANDIRARNLSISLSNFYNKATDITLPITSLAGSLILSSSAGQNPSQIDILPDSKGVFRMDSAGMMLDNFLVRTSHSRISATAAIPNALMEMRPEALLDVDVDASLGLKDINAFMPDLAFVTSALPADVPLNAIVEADGRLGDADIKNVDVKLPGVLSLRASGKAKNALDIKKMVANIRFEGELSKPSVINNFVEAAGIRIPKLSFEGDATAAAENYSAAFSLRTPHGDLVGDGKVGMNSEFYQADVKVDNLNVGAFIGDTLIGPVSASLYARGAGFNPEKKGAHTDIRINLDKAVYNHQTLKDIDVKASLANGNFTIDANSFSQPLYFNVAGKGVIADDFYQADLTANLRKVDLQLLGLSDTTNYGSGRIHLSGSASPRAWTYDVTLSADSLDWHLPDMDIALPDGARARLVADAGKTSCSLDAKGTSVDFISGVGLKSLIDSFSSVAALIPQSIAQRRIDVPAIEAALPPFRLSADVDGNGIARDFLAPSGMDIGSLDLQLSKDSVVQGNLLLNSLKTESMQLDTITFDMRSRGQLIDYTAHLGNRPGTMDEFADVNVSGYLGENRLSAYLVQHNIKNKMGYRVGFTASVADSIMSVRFTPLKATIAYMPWKFNTDNYVDFNIKNMKLQANLLASSDESSILLRTEPDGNGTDALHLNLKNIHVQDFLQMALNAPPVKATVNSDLNVSYNGRALLGKGNLDISDLIFDKKRVGDFSFTFAAGLGNKGRSGGKIGLLIDKAEAASVQFVLAPDSLDHAGGMVVEHLSLGLTRFPLSVANPFLPSQTLSLSGRLNGNMAMSGTFTRPLLNGSIAGDSLGVYVNMLGSTLHFSPNPVVVENNVLKFDHLDITAVNNNPLSLNGSVDASKLTDIMIDLTASAKNMQLTGGKKSKGDITGNLFVDLDASVKGPMSRLIIDANLDVLPTTDVTYVMSMGSDMLSGQSAGDDVVKFVNFADSTLVAKADSLTSSMSMRITAKAVISQGSQITVDLGGQGKVECNPSGTLNYFQNFMGDMRLNGTLYTGTGYARYNVPILGNKAFDFDRNSHITWNGDILNPTLDISATDEMKTNIQSNGNTRLVNFIVSLDIGNTLSAPSVNFDLSTNDDMSISNELQSMTADQRQQQAMNLLLTGTYTGPSARTVNSNVVTGNLYNFLTSQLNNFAAQAIKGVDINFGVNQYEVGQDGNTSTNTSYSYQVSKSLINNRFKILVGGNYSTDASADENFQQNLISDIAFEYILRQTNTMSLNARLFRHTGYESILEGEITETGVGLSLRRRLAYFTEITHFGLSKLWKKSKDKSVKLPTDSVVTTRSDSIVPPSTPDNSK